MCHYPCGGEEGVGARSRHISSQQTLEGTRRTLPTMDELEMMVAIDRDDCYW